MSYLYHLVPATGLIGNELVPLNTLKSISPTAYDYHFRKYENRPRVPEQGIPPLDCGWNDVVFFTAVHPQVIASAYDSCGVRLTKRRFYRIDPKKIDLEHTTVWLCKSHSKEPEDFVPFDPQRVEQFSEFPAQTLEYYQRMVREGRRREMLIFAYIPHILFKGTVDVSDAEIIEV